MTTEFKSKETMISKDTANYVSHPVQGKQCAGCSMFREPGRCTLVKGKIEKNGHCKFWEKK